MFRATVPVLVMLQELFQTQSNCFNSGYNDYNESGLQLQVLQSGIMKLEIYSNMTHIPYSLLFPNGIQIQTENQKIKENVFKQEG